MRLPVSVRGLRWVVEEGIVSVTNFSMPSVPGPDGAAVPGVNERPLHRIGVVRRLQGISRRTVARRLNIDVATIKLQENEASDMLLSSLYRWRDLLEVPVSELLVESEDPLSEPVMKRAQLVRLMKTALAIAEQAERPGIRRMAQTLIAQLTEIMPELEGVGPWHAVGQRRRRDELGRVVDRRISDDVFLDLMD